jgi:hypothetical protein
MRTARKKDEGATRQHHESYNLIDADDTVTDLGSFFVYMNT